MRDKAVIFSVIKKKNVTFICRVIHDKCQYCTTLAQSALAATFLCSFSQ